MTTIHENLEALHPRPQLARRPWVDLCGEWDFAYDDLDVGLRERWQRRSDVYDRTIVVPFPPESSASGIGDNSFHPVVWYRRTMEITPDPDGKHTILHCGAIDYYAHVWVNGQLAAVHEGGQTPFEADITGALNPEGEQVIVVRAEDRPADLTQPRGKQDWREEPHLIWYKRTTGIWQPMWLETVAPLHITDIRWTPNIDRGTLGMEVLLNGSSPRETRVRVQLTLHGEPILDDLYTVAGSSLQRELALDVGSTTMSRERILWFPEFPNLIDATVSVIMGDETLDEVYSYAGLRSMSIAGGRFMLNGRPYFLRMALEQGYWPESHLAAPSEQALRREVQLAKELGFNGVRVHQKVEDPRYLYWCDRLGLLVWGEIGSAFVFSREAIGHLMREWTAVLQRDYSHPCIVAWVPLNESWGVPSLLADPAQQDFVRAIFHLTKALDPTRPVIANDGWEYLLGDVFGIHDYTFSGDTIRERYGSSAAVERTMREVQPAYRFVSLSGPQRTDVPVMLTEFGGIGFGPGDDNEAWYGYGSVQDIDEFCEKYQELIDAVLDCPTVAGFCYTQLTDTEQERNGLLTEDRVPKLDPATIRSITRRASSAVAGDVIAQLRKTTGTAFGSSTVGADADSGGATSP